MRQQGRAAVDLTTEYRGYSADEGDITYCAMQRFYVNDQHVLWQLTVYMPAAGQGREGGRSCSRTSWRTGRSSGTSSDPGPRADRASHHWHVCVRVVKRGYRRVPKPAVRGLPSPA
ncbi:hypothetical protein NKH77_23075 [Streptomyces sp. M19]